MSEIEHPAVAVVEDLVIANEQSQVATAAVIDEIIDDANERVAEAEALAARITEAALENERGQHIARVEETQWHQEEEIRALRTEVKEMSEKMTELLTALSSLATTTAIQAQSPASSLSTPPTSEGTVQEAVAETMEILPGNLENVVEENPVPVPPVPQKRKRWI